MIIMKKTFHIRRLFVVLVTLLAVSCGKETKPPISQENFIEIYTYLNIFQELRIDKDYYEKLVEELLAKHKVTVMQIDQTVQYYKNNPQKWDGILKKVRERMTEIREEQKTKKSRGMIEQEAKSRNEKDTRE